MTLDEFLLALGGVHDQFGWCLVPDVHPDAERRAQPRKHLRGIARSQGQETVFDPIGAVCYARTGTVYLPHDWPDAGEALKMAPRDAAVVVAASSDRTWTGPEGQRESVPTLLDVRVRMIAAVGLARTAGSGTP